MNSTISYGGAEYPVTPMSLVEVLEVMFILSPYLEKMAEHETMLEAITSLINQVQEKEPIDLMRLLAHILHADAEELISDEVTGPETILALTVGFDINPIIDITDAAFILGISTIGWPDGSERRPQ